MSNHLANSYDYLLKFLVVGNAGVGKSCMLHQFLHKRFSSDTQHTIGAELGSKILTVDPAKNEQHERKIKLQIWDTAGQERFRAVTRSYYRGACGCLLVYDVTDRESFASVSNWLKDAKSLASENITIILCGNKSDLTDERQVTTAEATSFAEENNMIFLETSAKTSKNVDRAFEMCTNAVIAKVDSGVIDVNKNGSGILQNDRKTTMTNSKETSNIDQKIDLLKRETEEAISKFKSTPCCK